MTLYETGNSQLIVGYIWSHIALSCRPVVGDHCVTVNIDVQEAARQHITQERDVMQSIKETTNNEEGLLKQLDSRVSPIRLHHLES